MTYYTLIIVENTPDFFESDSEYPHKAKFDLVFNCENEIELSETLINKILDIKKNEELLKRWGLEKSYFDAISAMNTTMFDGNDDNLYYSIQNTHRLFEEIIYNNRNNVLDYFTEHEWKNLRETERILHLAIFDSPRVLQFRLEYT